MPEYAVLVARFFDLAAAGLRMLSPVTDEQLIRLGQGCGLRSGQLVLDVACGRGELLCRWSHRFGVRGVGVDISEAHIAAARDRATRLALGDAVRFEVVDAVLFATRESARTAYDVACCIGGCRYLGELGLAAALLRDCVGPDGLVVLGEPYWIQPPPDEAYHAIQVGADEYTTLVGTVDRVEAAGLEVVDMVVADPPAYDQVWVPQWRAMADWFRANPGDPDAQGLRRILTGTKRAYLEWGRAYLGFATFVCRPA